MTKVTITITKVNKRIDERIDDVSMVAEKVNQMSPLRGEETIDPGGEGDQSTTSKHENI